MADIGKINAVALANIAKVDAVAAAAIAKINGLVFTTAAGFLLDTYTGAAAGYSTRRLATSATNLMRIREDAGDTETDIGYDSNNELDSAAIATHCGTANGYVVTWYDQAGSNNATQGTEASQPQIYNGTAVITENGKPALDFDGSNDTLKAQFASVKTQPNQIVSVIKNDTTNFPTGGFRVLYSGFNNSSARHQLEALQNTGYLNMYAGSSSVSSTVIPTTQTLLNNLVDGGNSEMFLNGTSIAQSNAGAFALDGFTIGARFSNQYFFEGVFQELILWNADQSSNRTGIEENINSEYLIYQPTDAPTSGLLADYTGAAAAYSVRQLSDKAVMSMRVRRDSDDVEHNFGFDSNGDLDTAGIASFCGTANGYVTRWWDQSTNGNHADQATDASQPQIYNGTAVITENGKPAIESVLSGAQGLSIPTLTIDQTDFSLSHVAKFFADSGSFDNGTFFFANSTATNATNSTKSMILMKNSFWLGTNSVSGYANRINFTATTNQRLFFANGVNLFIDGSSVGTHGTSGDATYSSLQNSVVSNDFNRDSGCHARTQELILWDVDRTSNRTAIESNIDTYFSIT